MQRYCTDVGGQRGGRRLAMETQPPPHLIDADVLVDHRVVRNHARLGMAAPRARRAAHFEDVGEVGAEAQAEGRVAAGTSP